LTSFFFAIFFYFCLEGNVCCLRNMVIFCSVVSEYQWEEKRKSAIAESDGVVCHN
jgi:hypothetical protein